MVKNLSSLVEQKMLEMTSSFDRYQEIGLDLEIRGPEGADVFGIYLLNYSYVDIGHRKEIAHLDDLYLTKWLFGSFMTSSGI